MKPLTRVIVGISLLIGFFAGAGLRTAFAGVAVDLTEPGIGARVIGLGGAFLSLSDDTSAVYVNPAGLEQFDAWQVASSMRSTPLNRGTVMTATAVSAPGAMGTLGFGLITANVPAGFETFRDQNGLIQSTGQAIGFQSNVAVLAYSFDLSRIIYNSSLGHLYFGGNFKYFSQKFSGALSGSSGDGFNMDFSILAKPKPGFKMGLVAKNVLPVGLGGTLNFKSGNQDTIPTVYQWGFGYQINPTLWGLVDIKVPVSKPTTFNAGMEWTSDQGIVGRLGVEQAVVATGVDLAVITNFTAGVGYQWNGLRFDYAYRQDTTLQENSGHFFSIGLAGMGSMIGGGNRPIPSPLSAPELQ